MKKSLAFAPCVLAASLVAACGSPGQGSSGSGKGGSGPGDGTLTYAWTQAHDTFDPDKLTLRQMGTYLTPVYDRLIRQKSDQSLAPMLATKWSSGSDSKGSYLDLTLRTGLTFPDGTPFTSKTVALNLERSRDMKGSQNTFGLKTLTVERTDKSHVRLRTKDGVGYLPGLLSGPRGMMISDKALTEKKDLTTKAYGIGPYVLDSVQPNRVTYKKAEGYWDKGAAGSNKLEILFQSDDAKLNAIRSKSIDITFVPEKMAETAKNAGYRLERRLDVGSSSYYMNTKLKPLDNPKVREALHLALDRDRICKSVWDGACKANTQLFGVGAQEYNKRVGGSNGTYDPSKAKRLIKEAGAQGASITLAAPAGNQNAEKATAVFQQELLGIGLKAKILPLSTAQLFSRLAVEKNVHITFGGMGLFFDPSQTVARVMPDGGFNPGGQSIGDVAPLLAKAKAETNEIKRTKIYQQISTKISTDAYLIPILSAEDIYVVAKNVKGRKTPWAAVFPDFRGVSG